MGESSGTSDLHHVQLLRQLLRQFLWASYCSGFSSSLTSSLSCTDHWSRLSFHHVSVSSKRSFPPFNLSLQSIFPVCYWGPPIWKFSVLPVPHKPITLSGLKCLRIFLLGKKCGTFCIKPLSFHKAVLFHHASICLVFLKFFSYFNWKLFGRKKNTNFLTLSYFIEYPPNCDICHAWRSFTC